MLKGKELYLKIIDGKAVLASDKILIFQDAIIQSYLDRLSNNLIFKVEIFKVFEYEQRISVRLLDVIFNEGSLPMEQDSFLDELIGIEYINFREIDTSLLLKAIGGNRNSKGNFIKYWSPTDHVQKESEQTVEPVTEDEKFNFSGSFPYKCPNKDLHFFDGGVYFDLKFDELKEPLRIEIFNAHIKKEYSAILPYFNNIIGRDSITVKVELTISNGVVDSVSASCEEFNLIGNDFADKVRYRLISDIDKENIVGEIFTTEKFLKEKTGKSFSETDYFKSEEDFVKELINQKNTKHFKWIFWSKLTPIPGVGIVNELA
nr:hypothetical protein [uncultured Carboxylicivirga sp.]